MNEKKTVEGEDEKSSQEAESPPARKDVVSDGDAIAEVGDAVGGPA